MSETVLEHPLVRGYLRELNIACAYLPLAQARELREQIAAHLDEALPPSASDNEVQAELARLGSPRSLAGDAAGPQPRTIARRLRIRLGRVSWRGWVSVVVIVALAGSALAYTLLAYNGQLNEGAVSGWYYPQDGKHSVWTQAGGGTQNTVPERFGQQQGFEITIVNNSDFTQTVVGLTQYSLPFKSVQVAVGSGTLVDTGGSSAGPIRWSLPGSIPPHGYRMLRVLWTSNTCQVAGSTLAIKALMLTVRVGIFTRTEEVPLLDWWAMAADKSSSCH
jgi:hypothetical protein